MGDQPYLTARQTAALLQVSIRTVYNWSNRRLIASVRLPGGLLRFRRADVEKLVQSGPEPLADVAALESPRVPPLARRDFVALAQRA
jgi:excisionase family DNA binding protein